MHWIRFAKALFLSSLLGIACGDLRAHAQENPQRKFAESFQKAIAEKDFDGALKLIDESSDLPPESLAQPRIQLGSFLVGLKRTDEAVAQFNQALEATYAKLEDGSNPRLFVFAVPTATMFLRQTQPELADQWIDKGLVTLESRLDPETLSESYGFYSKILQAKLNTPDKEAAQQVKDKLLGFISNSEKIFAAQSNPSPHARTMIELWNDALSNADEELVPQFLDKIQALAQTELKQSPTSSVLQAYTSAVGNFVSRNARSDPGRASEQLEAAKVFIDSIESDDTNLIRVRENFAKNAERLSKTIESANALLSMVGKPAPAIDPQEWVHGEPETMESLRGRVVLLDFWAVWCGPCIATFPHLKHLDAEYGPKGLTIIGVTRWYNYSWDDTVSNAKRAEEPVALEDEFAMLEKFIAKHELAHRTMVAPKESKMYAEYNVTGIPHAVLLDKQGNVRLVKVGSGDKNAQDIEAMVQVLLAE